MFCQNCGANLPDDNSKFCPNCGKAIKQDISVESTDSKVEQYSAPTYQNPEEKPVDPKYNTSKAGIGFVCSFFLGLIGLIIGICLYPEGTVARQTFIKGWVITLVVTLVASFFLGIAVALLVPTEALSYYEVILPFLA